MFLYTYVYGMYNTVHDRESFFVTSMLLLTVYMVVMFYFLFNVTDKRSLSLKAKLNILQKRLRKPFILYILICYLELQFRQLDRSKYKKNNELITAINDH